MPAWLVGAVATLDLFWAAALTIAWVRGARELRQLLQEVELLEARHREKSTPSR